MASVSVGSSSFSKSSQTFVINYTQSGWSMGWSGNTPTASCTLTFNSIGLSGGLNDCKGNEVFSGSFTLSGMSSGSKTFYTAPAKPNSCPYWNGNTFAVNKSITINASWNGYGWNPVTAGRSGSSSYKNSSGTSTTTFSNQIFNLTQPGSPNYGSPSAPSVTISGVTQTSFTRKVSVGSYGNGGIGGSWSFYYGTGSNYNINGGLSTTQTLYGLSANTTYNWRARSWNDKGTYSGYVYGSFTTPAWTPPASNINSVTNVAPNSFRINYSTWGSDVSQVRVYVNGSHWTTLYWNPGYVDITGLSPKNTYSVYIQPYNDNAGWGNNSNTVYGTTYPNPVHISTITATNVLPFTATGVITSTVPGDTAAYKFQLLNSSGSVIQTRDFLSSSTWNILNLTPETTYTLRGYVRTNSSGVENGGNTYTFTTPADQASIFIKVNGGWLRGKVWIKVADIWMKAKKVYVKINGSWQGNKND